MLARSSDEKDEPKAGYPLPGTPEVLYNMKWFIV